MEARTKPNLKRLIHLSRDIANRLHWQILAVKDELKIEEIEGEEMDEE